MFKFVSNIPIFRRLLLAFVLVGIIPGIIISILGAVFINTQSSRSQVAQTNLDATRASSVLSSRLDSMNASFTELLTNPPASFTVRNGANDPYSNFITAGQSFDSGVVTFQHTYQVNTAGGMDSNRSTLTSDDPGNQLANQQQSVLSLVIGQLWPTYKHLSNQLITNISKGQFPTATQLQAVKNAFTPLRNEWTKVDDTTYQIGSKVSALSASQINPIILELVIAFLSTTIVIVCIGYLVTLTITRPLGLLATLTKRIARGETTARARVSSNDEIGMIASSMNNMLDHIVRLIQQTQSQRDDLQSQVEKLVSEVSGVGEGDLRVQAQVTADALGVLADSFNYMIEELASLVVRVKTVASEVESSTAAILDRMTQLVEVGDVQIAQITDATEEVEVMAGSSRQVAERSQHLHEVAYIARQDAHVGRQALTQTIEGMGRINENVQATATRVQTLGERSREINEIVDVISGIAHQTNRLALDAAIQAAMAGENGKGFGAVAADIRRLAERAKDQASMITRIVRSVREDIGSLAVSMRETERETSSGARLTREAGVALSSIFAAVENQAHEIELINHMAVQQLESSSAVVQIMQAVSLSTQQSSFSTRDASNNMQRLARLVEQLRSSVEAFKLRDSHNYFFAGQPLNPAITQPSNNSLTVSGVLRTVSTAQYPQAASIITPSQLSEPVYDPFSLFPMTSDEQWGMDGVPSHP